MSGEVSYKTHILIGVRSNGIIIVIADWPHVPKQAEVQKEINALATVMLHSRSVRRRPSCLRRAMTDTPGVTHGTDAASE
jgi:hypothetical protein